MGIEPVHLIVSNVISEYTGTREAIQSIADDK